jgi:ankyrin repeat protein
MACVRLLLDSKANVDARCGNMCESVEVWTPLHWACQGRHMEWVRLLLTCVRLLQT